MAKPDIHVVVCTNTRPPGHARGSCAQRGAHGVFQRFFDEVESHGLLGRVLITGSTCTGPCELGPSVIVHPGGHWYREVTEDDVAEIVESHLAAGKPVERLLMPDSAWP